MVRLMMGMLRRAWQTLHLTEKGLLCASLLVIAVCAGATWKLRQRQTKPGFTWQDPPASQPITWDDNTTITVDVSGAVRHPGIVRLPPNARVRDAIHKAGGLLPDANDDDLNLAAPLNDGEKILVASNAVKSTFTESTFDSNLININRADAQELQKLPDVGPVMAGRIVAYRQEHGTFHTLDELSAIKGVGSKTLEKWRPLVIFH